MNEPKQVQSLSPLWISIRILQRVILVYITICIIYFSFYTIPAFVRYLNDHSLNTILRATLRNIGVGLSLLEMLFSLRLRKSPGHLLLYVIIVAAAFSSWQQRAYGTGKNINSVLWMAIVFILFYSAVYHFKKEDLQMSANISYALTLVVWCTACCLSLIQFALQIGSLGPNHSTSPWLSGEGFVGNRLTGIFGYPEYGAVFGAMLIFIGLYYILRTRNLIIRLVIALGNLPLFFYLVLSGSRNAMVALYAAAFIGAFLYFFRNESRVSEQNPLAVLGLALLVVLALHCLYVGTKKAAEQVPGHFSVQPTENTDVSQLSAQNNPQSVVSSRPSPYDKKSFYCNRAKTPAVVNKSTGRQTNIISVPMIEKVNSKSSAEKDSSPGLLDRKYSNGDISTGRIQIWKEYLSLYKEIGFVGLSPENASFYIQEHFPDLYICSFIREVYPERYAAGYVFHTHNGYLRVFVATGFIGLACMLLFFLRVIVTVVSHVRNSDRLSAEFLVSLMVVVVGASSAMFDNEVFFNMNPTSLVFWIAFAILMRNTVRSGKSRKTAQTAEKRQRAVRRG